MATSIVRRAGGRLKRAVTGATRAGAVDGCDGVHITGWTAAAPIRILHGDHLLLEAAAAFLRPDVAAAGVGPLESGFSVPVQSVLDVLARMDDGGVRAQLRVVCAAGDLDSGHASVLDVNDLVSAAALGLALAQGA